MQFKGLLRGYLNSRLSFEELLLAKNGNETSRGVAFSTKSNGIDKHPVTLPLTLDKQENPVLMCTLVNQCCTDEGIIANEAAKALGLEATHNSQKGNAFVTVGGTFKVQDQVELEAGVFPGGGVTEIFSCINWTRTGESLIKELLTRIASQGQGTYHQVPGFVATMAGALVKVVTICLRSGMYSQGSVSKGVDYRTVGRHSSALCLQSNPVLLRFHTP